MTQTSDVLVFLPHANYGNSPLDLEALNAHCLRGRATVLMRSRMAFAYCMIAVGSVLTFSGLVAVALTRNELHSSAQI